MLYGQSGQRVFIESVVLVRCPVCVLGCEMMDVPDFHDRCLPEGPFMFLCCGCVGGELAL